MYIGAISLNLYIGICFITLYVPVPAMFPHCEMIADNKQTAKQDLEFPRYPPNRHSLYSLFPIYHKVGQCPFSTHLHWILRKKSSLKFKLQRNPLYLR